MIRGAYNPVSNEDRTRLVSAYEEGRDWVGLADVLGVKRKTARTVISVYNREGRVAKLPAAGGRPKVMLPHQMESVRQLLETTPTATLGQMRTHLLQLGDANPVPHVSTLSRALDGELLTLKVGQQATFNWNEPVTKEARLEYATWMLDEGVNRNLIFLDEFGFNIWTARTQGWAPRGQRAVRIVNGQRGKNLSLCLAISPEWGLVHSALVEGGFRNEHFADFLVELDVLVEAEWTLVFDGARAHNAVPGLSPQHSTFQLPPYSPFLNPAECAGSCVKAAVKQTLSAPNVQQEIANGPAAANLTLHAWRMLILKREVEAALPVITREKCMQWSHHTTRYYGRCLNREDILF